MNGQRTKPSMTYNGMVDALQLCRRLLGSGSHSRSRGAVNGVDMEKSALERLS